RRPARVGSAGGQSRGLPPAALAPGLVPEEVAGVSAGVLLQVLLMIVLRRPERAGGNDLGDDFPFPLPRARHLILHALGDLSLLLVVVEDRGAVLGADVVALAVERRRVVHAEEVAEEVLVAQA